MKLKKLRYLLLLASIGSTSLAAQSTLTVWPGDVNNNGVVNGVDVLWWSVAQDERGPKRGREDSLWAAQEAETWTGSFPSGLNYAYADCDGNGIINEADLRVIRQNFNLTRPENLPDVFSSGTPGVDPVLDLRYPDGMIGRGETAEIDVFLGDSTIPALDFFGIAFTIPYDPEVTGRQEQRALFQLEKDSWLGRQNSEVKEFVFNDAELGKMHVAIYRKKKEVVPAGAGKVGIAAIVIAEDIVSGITKVDAGLEMVKMIDDGLRDKPVAVDTVSIPIRGFTTSAGPAGAVDRQVRVFPNPVRDRVLVEWTGARGRIESIEVFNLLGQPLQRVIATGDRSQAVDLTSFGPGLYLLRIRTSEGTATRPLTKE